MKEYLLSRRQALALLGIAGANLFVACAPTTKSELVPTPPIRLNPTPAPTAEATTTRLPQPTETDASKPSSTHEPATTPTEFNLTKPPYVVELRKIVNGELVPTGKTLSYTADQILKQIRSEQVTLEIYQVGPTMRCNCNTGVIAIPNKYDPTGPKDLTTIPLQYKDLTDTPQWIQEDYKFLSSKNLIGMVITVLRKKDPSGKHWQPYFTGYRPGVTDALDKFGLERSVEFELQRMMRYTTDPQGLIE